MKTKLIDFSTFSSIRCGSPLEVKILEGSELPPANATIIGHGNNLLVSPKATNLYMLSKDFSYIKENPKSIEIGAATPSGKIYSYAKKHNIGGLEFLAKLPGSLGGIIYMNAGVKEYEIKSQLLEVKIDNSWIAANRLEFSYRKSAITGLIQAAKITHKGPFDQQRSNELQAMRENQPKGFSAGSAFKNPHGDFAGRLIEAVGLKGYCHGGFCFSSKHANFLINFNNGTFQEAVELLELAKKKVYDSFKIRLQEEIKIIY